MSTIPVAMPSATTPRELPSRGRVGMFSLVAAEATIFSIFVVAYIYYMGKSLSGPTPRQVLDVPIFDTICLLSSSVTIHAAVSALRKGSARAFTLFWAITAALGAIFLGGTAFDWYHMIVKLGFTIRTNLFGTTYYSLVGLHAFHVTVGLIMLGIVLIFTLAGKVRQEHTEKLEVLSIYWHFVDAVWVVVFTVVYIVGR
jgi:cytochrome c oxidase subunit III